MSAAERTYYLVMGAGIYNSMNLNCTSRAIFIKMPVSALFMEKNHKQVWEQSDEIQDVDTRYKHQKILLCESN